MFGLTKAARSLLPQGIPVERGAGKIRVAGAVDLPDLPPDELSTNGEAASTAIDEFIPEFRSKRGAVNHVPTSTPELASIVPPRLNIRSNGAEFKSNTGASASTERSVFRRALAGQSQTGTRGTRRSDCALCRCRRFLADSARLGRRSGRGVACRWYQDSATSTGGTRLCLTNSGVDRSAKRQCAQNGGVRVSIEIGLLPPRGGRACFTSSAPWDLDRRSRAHRQASTRLADCPSNRLCRQAPSRRPEYPLRRRRNSPGSRPIRRKFPVTRVCHRFSHLKLLQQVLLSRSRRTHRTPARDLTSLSRRSQWRPYRRRRTLRRCPAARLLYPRSAAQAPLR